jgi:hypothetical protein
MADRAAAELQYLRELIDELEDTIQTRDEDLDDPLYPVVQGPGGLNTAVLRELFVNRFNMRQIAEAYEISHDMVRRFASDNGLNRFDEITPELHRAVVEYMRENLDRNVGYHEWHRILIKEFDLKCGVNTVQKMLKEADPEGA